MFPRTELDVEQQQDDRDADGNNERQTLLLLAEAVKLARPCVVRVRPVRSNVDRAGEPL